MVVRDFNLLCITFTPDEADAPLIVDADAMLAFTVSAQRFQVIPGWRG